MHRRWIGGGHKSTQALSDSPHFVTLAQAQGDFDGLTGTVPKNAVVDLPSGSVLGPGTGASAPAPADGAEKSDDESAAPLVGLAPPGAGLIMDDFAIMVVGSALIGTLWPFRRSRLNKI
jgi:hypothetical protein